MTLAGVSTSFCADATRWVQEVCASRDVLRLQQESDAGHAAGAAVDRLRRELRANASALAVLREVLSPCVSLFLCRGFACPVHVGR
eukprot:CAMPEP_0173433076 /NCGR_PEP_ID=MMETSP1357-20121228/10663_1 /TAXON_ID=77926 /ORGANISM="Hemiselmis rufescens, Strain PCC563" /LENGTH=85 /DNA_ID=CAMNT_0014397755 /DNA_START=665 /DNA_END=922 /DNA_ORIENTATION=+